MFLLRSTQKIGGALGAKRFLSKGKTFWGKSSAVYFTYIVVGAVTFEVVYGAATDSLWEYFNRGVSLNF